MNKQFKGFVQEAVAGAARALWSQYGKEVQGFLETAPGARIVHYQASLVLNVSISLIGYSILCGQRRQVANEAQYLVMNRGATSDWLYGARPGQIVDAGEHARRADESLGRFKEVYQGAEERDSTVADAAQWLYHNRGSRLQSFIRWSPATIVKVHQTCKANDEAEKSCRHYTGEDLIEAYRLGFLAASDSESRAACQMATYGYKADRDDALGGL